MCSIINRLNTQFHITNHQALFRTKSITQYGIYVPVGPENMSAELDQHVTYITQAIHYVITCSLLKTNIAVFWVMTLRSVVDGCETYNEHTASQELQGMITVTTKI
jgi:hypothetical protein